MEEYFKYIIFGMRDDNNVEIITFRLQIASMEDGNDNDIVIPCSNRDMLSPSQLAKLNLNLPP